MVEGTTRYRPSGGRLAGMAALTLVAVAAFVLLADVRLNYDDPWFGVSDSAARPTMTAVLVVLEAVCLVGALVLLLVHGRTDDAYAGEWASDPLEPPAVPGKSIQIGCPGCGTVFEKPLTDVDEPHEQNFSCPNCGRAGRLRMGLHKSVQVRHLACMSCGRDFQAYRETAECPYCHAKQ